MMVDFKVVMDKLHSFETADDLAEFFRGYGIKAVPQDAKSCVISKFVETELGAPIGSVATTTECTTLNQVAWDGEYEFEQAVDIMAHTDAMKHFVKSFDRGVYPDLVVDGFIFDGIDYNCSCSMCKEY